ncbi:hypothetical protein [Streptomyces mirabilis]|uniref:hypothetical protein n=1 Tax=Streptomyces mirabilis TaxID=68239 RepID=UPI0036EDC6F6
MACARSDFYTPKGSSRGQLLETKENLQKMLANIPLTDDERAAVDDGQAALDQLLERLTDVPTPAGPTPRQIGVPATAALLPVVEVRQSDYAYYTDIAHYMAARPPSPPPHWTDGEDRVRDRWRILVTNRRNHTQIPR